MIFAALLFQMDAVARAEGGLDTFSIIFMLTSMLAVTILAVWCFYKVLGGKEHFDPDGTGPARPPVKGEAE